MLSWHYITSAAYKAATAEQKTSDKLFFLSDTKQIYRGTELFTESVTLVTTWPTTPAVGRLYVNSSTLEGRIYTSPTDTTGTVVIQPVQAAIDSSNKTNAKAPASTKAVHDYTNGAYKDSSYTKGGTINFTTIGGGTDSVVITDLPCDLKYTASTGLLQLKDKDGTAIGTGITLDLERFVKSGSYDPETKKITLEFENGDPVEIDAAALVDIYTGANTDTATVSVSADNKISANVKVSTTSGNILTKDSNGLLVKIPNTVATTAQISEIQQTIATEIARAEGVEEELAGLIAANTADIEANTSAIATEKSRAEAVEAGLRTDVNAATAALTWKTTV